MSLGRQHLRVCLACGVTAMFSAGQDPRWVLLAQLGTLVRPGSVGWLWHRGGAHPPGHLGQAWLHGVAPARRRREPTLLGTAMDWACLVICIAIDAN